MPKGKNHSSKRTTLHQKYKIQKKVREHRRKIRKEEKIKAKKGTKLSTLKRKDPGIPNLWPFKEQVLAEVEQHKELVEKNKIAQRLEMKRARDKARKAALSPAQQMAELKNSAMNRQSTFELQEADKRSSKKLSDIEHTRRAYYRELHKIMENADVILEVLDARDPLGCRPTEVEKYIQQKDPNKRIVLVLNKIDLVPKEVVADWLKYLRREYPTVAIKCSTQSQKTNIGRSKTSALDASKDQLLNSECLGGEQLLQLLKNYSRNNKMKMAITVGVIGYPNVGKSSLINSLVRTRAVETGAQAGITKVAQEVALDKKVKLLDCPGIVFAKNEDDVAVILRNHVKSGAVSDPSPAVFEIVKRCDKMKLMKLYKLARFGSEQEFLQLVAQVRGKVKKGGVLDLEGAARSVLQDWCAGKIPYFTTPPDVTESSFEETTVVQSWGKEFDMSAVSQVDVLDAACAAVDDAFISFKGLSLGANSTDMRFAVEEDDGDEMEHDGPAGVTSHRVGESTSMKEDALSGRVSKTTKLKRAEAAAAAVRKQQNQGNDSGSDYDFAEAFEGDEGKFGALGKEDDDDEDDEEELGEENDDDEDDEEGVKMED